jgi:glycosyltransferase involved in cell wall biosynthesis
MEGSVARQQSSGRPYDSSAVRVAFLLRDIQRSGAVGVVVEHAIQLNRDQGFDAHLVLVPPPDEPNREHRGLRDLPVMTLEEARTEHFDVAAATCWQTASVLFHVPADRYAYFLQLLEDSTYPPDAPERLAASLTAALPARFITAAHWIAEIVGRYQPGNRVLYVRTGIAKETFRPAAEPAPADGPLRIVIEGSRQSAHTGVDDALAAIRLMREPRHVTLVTPHRAEGALDGVDSLVWGQSRPEMAELLRTQHVMLRLARVEETYGRPLEAFHMGATCVSTPVTGFGEHVRHDWNGVVVGWDDPQGTARALDLLARDRERLHFLRLNALRTAHAWPSLEQSTRMMALALRALHREPPPDPRAVGARLASEVASALADAQRRVWLLDSQETIVHDLKSQKAWRLALRIRDAHNRARAAFRRVRRLLRRMLPGPER